MPHSALQPTYRFITFKISNYQISLYGFEINQMKGFSEVYSRQGSNVVKEIR
jgi:hypothetical protein